MRRLLVVLALVMVAAVVYRSQGSAETGTGNLTLPQPAPNRGEAAPDFPVTSTVGGRPFEIDDKGTCVLAFWSPLNEGSVQAREQFGRLARSYGGEARFVAVYVGEALGEQPGREPYTILQDGSGRLTGLYNVKRVPRTFLIHDGTIRLVQNGSYPDDEGELREALDEILRQEEAKKDRRDT
jgi:hypothetical protein